jgi:hypothetical protein
MENLTEKVFECTLPVEAHMICDLLARAGISARVDGEFLAGAGGDLPLGNSVKVRVDPARAAEARAVIDDWEKTQPPDAPTPARPRGSLRGPLWFFLGGVCGAWFAWLGLNTPATENGIDYDSDGDYETIYHYTGAKIALVENDRDNNGVADGRWKFDRHGLDSAFESDDDFDGRFEWQYEIARGAFLTGTRDADADGKPEMVSHFSDGILRSMDLFDESGRVVAREHYARDRVDYTEFDRDGDGKFEQRVEFDRYGMPK